MCLYGRRRAGEGRGVALPRPPIEECKAKPCPYPRSPCGELGQHVVLSLPAYFSTVLRNESTSLVEGSFGWPRSELILP